MTTPPRGNPHSRRRVLTLGATGLASTLAGCSTADRLRHAAADPSLDLTLSAADLSRKSPTGQLDDLTLADVGLTTTFDWADFPDPPYTMQPTLNLDCRLTDDTNPPPFETLTTITDFSHEITTTTGEKTVDIDSLAGRAVSIPDAHPKITLEMFAPRDQDSQQRRTVELRVTGDIGLKWVDFDETRTTFDVTITRGTTHI